MKAKDLKKQGRIFNSWRSKVYTKKGKSIGFPDKWKTFEGFYDDVGEDYDDSLDLVLVRKDITKPYSKENCSWVPRGTEQQALQKLFTYNNVTKTLVEWCLELKLNYTGVSIRSSRHKNDYTPEQILFGKYVNRKSKPVKNADSASKLRAKASKMISSYKHKDKIRKLEQCDFDIDWFINNILSKSCVYCGDTNKIGADRIDNNKGHLKTNVVPCCYDCNCARNNNFSYEEMLILGKTIAQIKNSRNESY